jgi:hypothetical protein
MCVWIGWGRPKFCVGKHFGNYPFGRPRRNWEINTKMYVKVRGYEGASWKELSQDRFHWQGLVLAGFRYIRGCIQKFPDWPPGAGTANGTAFCH